jgi:membrane-bound acyltransferase YfiQ involved in biofilm formation
MIILCWLIWFKLGILGAIIYNSFMNYDNNILKYIWCTLVILCGGFGFIISCLSYIIHRNFNL